MDRRVAVDGEAARGQHAVVWGIVGVIAQLAFVCGWVIAETWQGPMYSPIGDTISDLQAATAPHVWFPIACFAVGGVGTFCFAVFGLRPALSGARGVARSSPWMLAVAGVVIGNSFPLIPCRLADPGCTANAQLLSPGGLTDAIGAGAAFLVLALIPFPLWRRLRALPAWRRMGRVMVTARVVGPASYLALAASSSIASMPAVGLIERVLATTCNLWIGSLAVNLIVEARRSTCVPRDGAELTENRSLERHL